MKKLIGLKKEQKKLVKNTLSYLGAVSLSTKGGFKGYMIEGQGGRRY
jgi:hypothetical protein